MKVGKALTEQGKAMVKVYGIAEERRSKGEYEG